MTSSNLSGWLQNVLRILHNKQDYAYSFYMHFILNSAVNVVLRKLKRVNSIFIDYVVNTGKIRSVNKSLEFLIYVYVCTNIYIYTHTRICIYTKYAFIYLMFSANIKKKKKDSSLQAAFIFSCG